MSDSPPMVQTALTLSGEWTVTKYRRDGTLIEETGPQPNSILPSGRQLLLHRLRGDYNTGADPAAQPMGSNTTLILRDASGNEQRRLFTAPPSFTSPNLQYSPAMATWRWRDSTTLTYTPAQCLVRNWNSASSYYDFSLASVSFGTKPSYEIWDYEYRLTLSPGTGSALAAVGVFMALGLLTGTESRAFDQSNTYLDGSTTGGQYINAWCPCTAIGLSTGSHYLEYYFAVPEGSSGTWANHRVYRHDPAFGGVGSGENAKFPLRDGASDVVRTKNSNERWTFLWRLSV